MLVVISEVDVLLVVVDSVAVDVGFVVVVAVIGSVVVV